MRVFRSVMITIVLLFTPAYVFSGDLGWMRISLMEGDVQIKTADSGDWGLALINGTLTESDQILVPQGGKVELQLSTGTYIRLDQNSALQILSMDKDSFQFYFSQGHAYIYYEAPKGNVIQIDTPGGSAPRGEKSQVKPAEKRPGQPAEDTHKEQKEERPEELGR